METAAADATGYVAVEAVVGRSRVTRCFAKYPLKFIVPSKAASSRVDAVWIYALTYGGGIVSGDCVRCVMSVGDGCTAVFTTQASTKVEFSGPTEAQSLFMLATSIRLGPPNSSQWKLYATQVYKSVESKISKQVLEASIGSGALLAVVPHPVTCFSTARYSQRQVFRIASDSNLLVVDWLTSGRHQSGEKWSFCFYKSTNNIFVEGDQPLFLDSVLLEQGDTSSIAERMQDYQVIGMIILIGPKLKHVQDQIQDDVKKMMSGCFHTPNPARGRYSRGQPESIPAKPALIASCSSFGPKAMGVVVRIAATETESVYEFLRHHLASMESLLGAPLYR